MYYIVINEKFYPNGKDRAFVGIYDRLEDAVVTAKSESDKEERNFISLTGDLYKEACGDCFNKNGECLGYVLHSSRREEDDFYFWSRIIKVEN